MIRPRSITIEGFRSFRDETTYHFPQGSGLYLVTGRNKLEPKLGANGAGKSALFDAMCWCLYGKSARGLRAGNVSHWSGEYLTGVQLILTVDDTERTIRRTRNPNSIRLDGNETDQQSIDQLVRVNYDGFLATVLLGQFNRFFFDLLPTEKLNVFSNALDLTRWTQAAEKAKNRSKEYASTLQQVEADQNATKAVIVNIQSSAKNLASTHREYERSRQQSKQVLQGYIQQREPELIDVSRQLKQQQTNLTRLQDELDNQNRQADRCDKKVTELVVLESRRKELRRQYDDLTNADSKCPTCGQPTNAKQLAERKRETGDSLAIVESRLSRLPEFRNKWNEALTAIQGIKRQLDKVNKQTNRLVAQRNQLQSDLQRKQDQLGTLDLQIDPYRQQLQQLKKDEFNNQQKLTNFNEQHSDLTKQLKATEFWTKGFKELRLWIIQDAIIQLQVEVDNTLTQLGLHGWKVELAIEKETKNGKLQRGFTVNIKSPDQESQTSVPWEAWSGGETQRIRIAGANGLQKLIQQRNGLDWNFEIFDEPTQHLSERGVADLLMFLEAKAKQENRQIWIISHQGLTAGNFDGMIEVVKGNGGSKIVEVA